MYKIKEILITSIEDFVKRIDLLEETDVYRGQTDTNFKLIPSVGRTPFDKPEKHLEQYEKSIFCDFKRKAPIFLKDKPNSDFEWLIMAQHFGLPTRLLDWTYNPLIALFFAIEHDKYTDCVVYQGMISRLLMLDASRPQDPFKIDTTYGIVPTLNNERYHNQNGVFTIYPKPYEEDSSFVIRKYIIPKIHKENMRWKLRKLGITKALIYPQLDSIAHDIIEIHKSKYKHYFRK